MKEIQRVRKSLLLSHKVQSGPTCFLNSLWSLGAVRSNLSLRLGQWVISNGIIYNKFIIINIEQLHELVIFH